MQAGGVGILVYIEVPTPWLGGSLGNLECQIDDEDVKHEKGNKAKNHVRGVI